MRAVNDAGEGVFGPGDIGFTAVDSDSDGVFDSTDNCPSIFNDDQLDTDGDGIGDVCDEDDDDDGVPDSSDAFPLDRNESVDTDGDGIGDNSDLDDDADGIPDTYELANGLNEKMPDATGDLDGDGWTNIREFEEGTAANDSDTDDDGRIDPLDPNPTVDESAIMMIINSILLQTD